MRLFIKVGSRDKLINLVKEGGGFQTVEVMVTNDFELMVPEPERRCWMELYPKWDHRTIKATPLQLGVLTALIMQALPQTQQLLHSVQRQLFVLKIGRASCRERV